MNDYVALHGPAYSGKTTLAMELAEKHGYMHIDFVALLKRMAAAALTAAHQPTTMEQIIDNKEFYRPFLQALGDAVGFQNNSRYIYTALEEWYEAGRPNAVFDNVRSDAQALTLMGANFRLVELHINQDERIYRAATMGHSYHAATHQASIEQPLSQHIIRSQILSSTMSPNVLAHMIVCLRGY